MSETVKRSFKYRFYPTPAQADQLSRTFGCVRLVYNKALDARIQEFATERRSVSYAQTSAMLTSWKADPDLAFLNEVSSVPLQQALRHLQGAYTAFFAKRAHCPRFKSKHRSRSAAEYTRSAFRFRGGQLTLAKMLEPLAIVWSRPLPSGAEPSTVTVSRDASGRWFISLLVEAPVTPLARVGSAIGVDMGLANLATLSTGETIANPRHERSDRRKLAKVQRSLSRKGRGSANRAKARLRLARIHARIADRRRDHLQKLSTRLVRENQTVVIEDLCVRGMVGNRSLARAIGDAGWSNLRFMLEYKARWYGRELLVVDRWFPSSRICSACGRHVGSMPLSVREWACRCGVVNDRDVNAACNILAAGLADRQNACGGTVRPDPRTRRRRDSAKQEIPRVTGEIPALEGGGRCQA